MKKIVLLHGRCPTTIQLLEDQLRLNLGLNIVGRHSYLHLLTHDGEQQLLREREPEIIITIFDEEYDATSWAKDIQQMTTVKRMPTVKLVLCLVTKPLSQFPALTGDSQGRLQVINIYENDNLYELIKKSCT